ncbi:hypothetical protein R6Q57_010034 [Mikania cordata]
MASLTPGVLSKLLQTLDNPTAKVAGDHRSPLLQVIGIVPKDDVFDFDRRNKGFYLRVSDSVHSAYVSVPEADVDLILSDKIQLGQFVHVTRLDSGSPVPIVCGIKPVAKRRPCVGDPKDLISSDLLLIRGNLLKKKKEGNTNTRRLSFSNGKIRDEPETRRLSLDYSSRKAWDRSPAPAVKHRRSGSEANCAKLTEPSSPLCSTPVRSVKKSSSVKDVVLKPPNLNVAPLKNKNVIVSEKLISSWDRSPAPGVKHRQSGSEMIGGLGAKVTESSPPLCSTPVRSVRRSSVKDVVLKPPNLNVAPLKNKNVIVSEKLISKPINKDLKTSFDNISVPTNLTKVPITFTDPKIFWDFVSPTIRQLGKEAICHRNLGFSSAVYALNETSAMDNIIQCMSRFAEICELSETSRNPLVEQFLNFYHKLQTSAAVVNTLIYSKSTIDETKSQPRNSALWVQAALATNLGKFTLFATEVDRKNQDSEGSYQIVLESSSDKIQVETSGYKKIPRTQEPIASKLRRDGPRPTMKNKSSERVKWYKGSGLEETAKLAEELLLTAQKWFLNYLEESLNKGFWLTNGDDSVVAVSLLGQLKRVNQWLDDSVCGDENVENLRKKMYGILLDHVQNGAM